MSEITANIIDADSVGPTDGQFISDPLIGPEESGAADGVPVAGVTGDVTAGRAVGDPPGGHSWQARVNRDTELLAAHRSGDPTALGTLLDEHYPATLGWAVKYASVEDDPEDLAQQAILTTMEAMARGGGPTHTLGLYLASVVRNLAFHRARKLRRTFPVPEFSDRMEGVAENLPEDGALVAAMESLNEKQRQLLWWREVEKIPTKEIAERIGMTSKATSMALTRARRALISAYRTASSQEGPDGFTRPGSRPGRHGRFPAKAGSASVLFAAVVAFVTGIINRRAIPEAAAAGSAPVAATAAVPVAASAPAAGVGVGAALAAKAPLLLLVCGAVGLVITSMTLIPGAGNSSESMFSVDEAVRDKVVTVIRQELPGDPGQYCEIDWYSPNADQTRRSHFLVTRTSSVQCRITVDWENTRLITWAEAGDQAVFLTPRPGEYHLNITVE